MIEAIYHIGKYALNNNGKSIDNPIDILIDNPSNRNTKNILFINLHEENDIYHFEGIELEEFDVAKLSMYLYRKGSPRGTDLSPTAMITEPKKSIDVKILAWFNKNNSNDFIDSIQKCLKKNYKDILQQLSNIYSTENNVISIKINGKYLGEYDLFKDILIEDATKNFYYKSSFPKGNTISKADNQYCSVCKSIKATVMGFVSTFKFYTVDKPGFVSSGFQQQNAWKNYPVCLECALVLEEGKKYLEKLFDFNFYGIRYLLLPKLILDSSSAEAKKVFKIFEQQRDPSFHKADITRLTSDENEVLDILSEFKNYLNLNFLFYYAPKGFNGTVFNILGYIQNILPSRLRNLFAVKKEVDQINVFAHHKLPIFKDGKVINTTPLEFNFSILRNFLYDSTEKKWISQKYFLDILNKIFSDKPISYDFILNLVIKKIQKKFSNNYATVHDTLKGFLLLVYLNKLNLIKTKVLKMNEEKHNLTISENELSSKVESFFDEFSDFFDADSKKAIFLLGALTQFLLNIQSRLKNSQPFKARLKGLKLDKKQIEKLFPEVQNKLEEYDKNYYKKLEEIISAYFLRAGKNWGITNDEISFYFVLGMNLSNNFKSEDKQNEEEYNESVS